MFNLFKPEFNTVYEKDGPLMIACKKNNFNDVVKIIFPNTSTIVVVDTDVIDKYRNTPLIIACKNNNFKIVKALVTYGVDITKQNSAGETALDIAYKNNNPEIINLLNNRLKMIAERQDLTEFYPDKPDEFTYNNTLNTNNRELTRVPTKRSNIGFLGGKRRSKKLKKRNRKSKKRNRKSKKIY